MPAAPLDPSALPGPGHTVLVIVPHADDAALFCGGTLRLMADRGARVALLRVTDDRYDSVGLDETATIAANTRDLHEAARLLGISGDFPGRAQTRIEQVLDVPCALFSCGPDTPLDFEKNRF